MPLEAYPPPVAPATPVTTAAVTFAAATGTAHVDSAQVAGRHAVAPPPWTSYAPPDPATAWPASVPQPYSPVAQHPASWPYPVPYVEQGPARSGGRPVAVIATVTVAVVILTCISGLLVRRHSNEVTAQRQAAAQADVLAHLPALEAFVADRTGRHWTRGVPAVVLDDEGFVAALHKARGGTPAQPREDLDDLGVTYTAMGLASSPDSFWGSTHDGLDSDVVGFYDDGTGALYVRGTAYTPYVEYVLVHELTHASQDQSFSLASQWQRTSTEDETPTALRALAEGEAMMVADDYRDLQSAAWQQSVSAADSAAGGSAAPLVEVLGGFPYVAGESFVRGVRDTCGKDSIRRLWSSPPRSTRALLDPAGWCRGVRVDGISLTHPAAPGGEGAHVKDVGVLGVEGLWAAVDADHPRLSDLDALDGWIGDSYVSTENADATRWCFADDSLFVDTRSRDRALSFLKPWLARSGVRATVTGARTLHLEHCTA